MESNFEVVKGKIKNKVTGSLLSEPSVIMMKDIGAPLKLGEYKELSDYMEVIRDRIKSDIIRNNYELIKFDYSYNKEHKITVYDVCNLMNYLQSCTIDGEIWQKIKNMDNVQLREFLDRIKE